MRCARNHGLSTVCQRSQAGATIQVRTSVSPTFEQMSLARMQCHPNTKLDALGPFLARQRELGISGRCCRIGRSRENRDDIVTLALLQRSRPPIRCDRRRQDFLMSTHRGGHPSR